MPTPPTIRINGFLYHSFIYRGSLWKINNLNWTEAIELASRKRVKDSEVAWRGISYPQIIGHSTHRHKMVHSHRVYYSRGRLHDRISLVESDPLLPGLQTVVTKSLDQTVGGH